MRNRSRWYLVPVAALTLALPAFTACGGGGDEKVAVDEWTEGLCDSLMSWLDDIGTTSALADIDSAESNEDIKDAMVAFFNDVDERTKELKEDIDGLGIPDTEDGGDIQKAFSEAFGEVVKIFEDSKEEVEGLDTDNDAELEASLTAIGEKLGEAGDKVGSSFEDIADEFNMDDINKAAEDIEACDEVFSVF